jgi:hypothetical protein
LSQHSLSRQHDWFGRALGQFAQLDAAWLVVLFSYFAVFGGMLVYSDFLPFTFDNNESFAAYLHARNMYEFGIVSSSGLPDESLSNDAAANPYLYTHAGASPRLFAYVLYVLGARTVELQLAVTAFTVGLLAFWFVYRFLADISTRLYAAVACLLLLTDYIMFAQWHIGLWHVWKTFLLFGGLYLAHRAANKEQSRPLLMVYAFHAFLFYYETIFNVYVAAVLFLYVVFATRDYRLAIKFGSAQVAGALTATVILLAQLVSHFGWDVVRADIYYTFIGRNFATDPAAFLEEARAFYATHNIAFWLNIPDSNHFRTLSWALQVLFQDHSVHTPPWSLVVLAFAAAELVRCLRGARASPAALSSTSRLATVPAAFVLGALSAAAFGLLARHPELAAGLPPETPLSISELWPVATGGGLLFAGAALATPPTLPIGRLGQILGASVFVAAALAFLLVQPALYAGGLDSIWHMMSYGRPLPDNFVDRLREICSPAGLVEAGNVCADQPNMPKSHYSEFAALLSKWQSDEPRLLTFHPADTLMSVVFRKPHKLPVSMAYADGFSPALFRNILDRAEPIIENELQIGQTVVATKDLGSLNELEWALLNRVAASWALERVDETEHLAVYKLVKDTKHSVGPLLVLPDRQVKSRNTF